MANTQIASNMSNSREHAEIPLRDEFEVGPRPRRISARNTPAKSPKWPRCGASASALCWAGS